MNTTVNFGIAKLLKEKGINIWSEYRYTDFNGVERLEKEASEIFPYAPTIADVVMWLYEKHGIWIYPMQSTSRLGFRCFIQRLRILGEVDIQNDEKYNSPTEAYEAAILYTLNNLI